MKHTKRNKREPRIDKDKHKKEDKKWRQNSKSQDNGEDELYLLNLRLNNLQVCECENIYSIHLEECPTCGVANPYYLPA